MKCLLDFAIVNSFTLQSTQKSTAVLYKKKKKKKKKKNTFKYMLLRVSYTCYQQNWHAFYKEVSAYTKIEKIVIRVIKKITTKETQKQQ